MEHENQLGERLMPKKHHAIYSDPTGAAAAASPVKRRAQRSKHTEADGRVSTVSAAIVQQEMAVDREAVARLAYSYWEARGFIGGSPEEDWLRAEREVRESLAASATA